MPGPLTVSQVETEVARRITALDATDYDQGSLPASWTEGEQFAQIGEAPVSIAHLTFHVFVDDSPNSYTDSDEPNLYTRLRSRCVVIFSYELRPDFQRPDSRLARDAAADIIKTVNDVWPEVNVVLVNAGQTAVSLDGSYLSVSILFDIFHEIEV